MIKERERRWFEILNGLNIYSFSGEKDWKEGFIAEKI